MLLENLKDIEDWLRDEKMQWWEILTDDRENRIAHESDSTLPLELRFEKLRIWYNRKPVGKYIINSHQETEELRRKRGRHRAEFQIMGTTPGVQSSGIGSLPDGYISRGEFDALWEKKELLWKIDRIQEELAELKKENNDLKGPKEEFLRQITPYVAPVIQGLVGKVMPNVAGVLPTQIEMQDVQQQIYKNMNMEKIQMEMEIPDADNDRLIIALEMWGKADPEWLILLEKIAKLAVDRPVNPFLGDVYLKAKEMLNSF